MDTNTVRELFPAGAGMNRLCRRERQSGLTVPRRRGDEPCGTNLLRGVTHCSPQARG